MEQSSLDSGRHYLLLIKGEHQPITLVAMGDEQENDHGICKIFEFCPKGKNTPLSTEIKRY